MAYTARSLIIQAFKTSGIRAVNDNPDDNDTNAGLWELNQLLAQLKTEDFWTAGEKPYVFQTSGGKIQYSIGVPYETTPGTFVTPDWPIDQNAVSIHHMRVKIGGVWTPMREISEYDYYRTTTNTAMNIVPTQFAFHRLADPTPYILLSAGAAGVWDIQVVTNMVQPYYELDDVINLPPEYIGLIQYGLAMMLCIVYQFDESKMASVYQSRLARLQSVNMPTAPLLKLDHGVGIYNIGSDSVLYSGGGL